MVRRLKLSFDDLSEFRGRLEDPRPALERVGALMLAESQKSFDDQAYGPERWPERYEGQPEPFINVAGALSDVARDRQIKGRRFDRRPALVDVGILRGSLTFALKGKKSVRKDKPVRRLFLKDTDPLAMMVQLYRDGNTNTGGTKFFRVGLKPACR